MNQEDIESGRGACPRNGLYIAHPATKTAQLEDRKSPALWGFYPSSALLVVDISCAGRFEFQFPIAADDVEDFAVMILIQRPHGAVEGDQSGFIGLQRQSALGQIRYFLTFP